MGYPEHPSCQELSAEKQRVQNLVKELAVAQEQYRDLLKSWVDFQQDLQSYLRDGYGESFTELAVSKQFKQDHPYVHKWVVYVVEQEANQRKEQERIQSIKNALVGLDDATLANMGLQRIK